MIRKPAAALIAALALFTTPALAEDVSYALKSFAELNIKPWIQDPVIIAALNTSNAITGDYDQAKIDALDAEWRAAVEGGTRLPLLQDVVSGETAEYLREKFQRSGGAIVEIILVDAKGLNVAATKAPSDYWQGDEPKFQNSFGAGKDGVDTGALEFDDSIGNYSAQITLPIADPATNELIGAVTVGVSQLGFE